MESVAMYAFTQDLPITPEMWFRIKAGIGDAAVEGLIVHVVIGREDGVRYLDVWESREACDRFLEERVHPVLRNAFAGAGAEMPGEPERVEFEAVDVQIPELAAAASFQQRVPTGT